MAFVKFLLHLDQYLAQITAAYGSLTYLVLFFIVFAETGFVFTPFLPGDSLLFAAGALASLGSLNLPGLLLLLWLAAFLGDTANYWIGHFFGEKIIANPRLPLNREHLNQAQRFYDQYGGKTIFLARFIPIVRTFAPFVAGIGKMEYRRFLVFNAAGGAVWVLGFTLTGYYFGNLPWVKANFSSVVLAIIFLSILPVISEIIKAKLSSRS